MIISTVLFVLALCGAKGTIAASEKSAGDCCTAITLEKAAVILSVPPEDLLKSSSEMMVSPEDLQKKTYKIHPYTCRIRSKSNFLKSINYIIYVYNDPGQARLDFDQMRYHYKIVSKVDDVPGIGDEAFRADDQHLQRMVAIKGGVVIDILNPKEFSLQKRVISLILEKF